MQPIVMMFGAAGYLADVIERAKSCIDRFKVSDLERVKVGSPISNSNVRAQSERIDLQRSMMAQKICILWSR